MNRHDLAMADSHGQVWGQVVAASSQDEQLFRGKCAEVEAQMKDVLQLGSEIKFPLRRLVTVWRNERWRAMATWWCGTAVGRATFQLTAWDRMISYRLDDVSAHPPMSRDVPLTHPAHEMRGGGSVLVHDVPKRAVHFIATPYRRRRLR